MADLVPLPMRVERELKDELEAEAARYKTTVSDIARPALRRRTIYIDGQSLACGVLVDALNLLRGAQNIDEAVDAIEAGLALLS